MHRGTAAADCGSSAACLICPMLGWSWGGSGGPSGRLGAARKLESQVD